MRQAVMVVLLMALAAWASGCTKPDDPGASDLCKASKDLTRAHFDQMERDEALGPTRWFWVEAPYKGQKAQKAAIYVDPRTGFILLAPTKGKIGAWISADSRKTVRDGHDRWGCEVAYLIKAADPENQGVLELLRLYRGQYPIPNDEPAAVARTVAEEMAKADLKLVLEEFGADVEMELGSIVSVECEFIEWGWNLQPGEQRNPMSMDGTWWPAVAGKRPIYSTSAEVAQEAFFSLAARGKRSVPYDKKVIKALAVSDARIEWEVDAKCPVDDRPVRAEEPPAEAPPGATPPDRGGVDVPPGTVPGSGSDDGGDR
jgi:hypothetical protein